jgi:serine/threonine protein kinase
VDNGRVDAEQPERLIAERYRLLRVLGRGSMGTVWAAHDEVLRRAVAVKEVLHPPGMPDAEADLLRERTLREARAIAALSHPNLVTLYDVVRLDGEPYVVMELVPSESLNELIKTRGPLTESQAAAVADAVAAALAAAHRAGITHRDVKPGNVLVADDGRIKLTDFGISRNVSESTLTSRGIMLGTPAFIAPEVASGDVVSPAADLWSLGATLFTAMAGYPPYDGENVLRTINQVVHGEVPEPVNAGALAPVISGLMQKDPDKRMSLVEVRRHIYPLLPEPGTLAFPVSDGEHPAIVPPVPQPIVIPKPAISPDTPLASAPGPLPFLQAGNETRSVPGRRSPLATILLVVAALLVFAGASGTGFAVTRLAAGASVLPPPTPAAPPLPAIDDTTTFEARVASAAAENGMRGGDFSVKVGRDWTSFVEQRSNDPLPPSTVVHIVSPTGLYELSVQRFPGFYPAHKIADYNRHLRARWGGQFFPGTIEGTPEVAPGGPEKPILMNYRTVETAGPTGSAQQATEMRRARFTRILPRANDLWVVEVTVPIEQEETGRDRLFNAIASTFTPLD